MSELAGAKRIHLMGIGGAGMSSLARLLSSMGNAVSGCDLRHESSYIKALEALGVSCMAGHSREHLERFDPQLVIFSSAVDGNCEELVAARCEGIRTVGRGEALSWLFNEARGVGVAGTHGKTTTTSMIGLVLERAGLSPTLYIGAEVQDIGTNARLGGNPLFVAELDESGHQDPNRAERDEGEFFIEEVLDRNGDSIPPNALEIRLQTLPRDEGFWLDTGIISD